MNKLKLSPPWTEFYRKIQALFQKDEGVNVVYDEDNMGVRLYVEDSAKAEALSEILPKTKEFGNVILQISVIPGNKRGEDHGGVMQNAFHGNDAVKDVVVIDNAWYPGQTFVVFAKEVVQFFDDNLGDLNGVKSTLYEDLARDVFSVKPGVLFCTASKEGVGYAFNW